MHIPLWTNVLIIATSCVLAGCSDPNDDQVGSATSKTQLATNQAELEAARADAHAARAQLAAAQAQIEADKAETQSAREQLAGSANPPSSSQRVSDQVEKSDLTPLVNQATPESTAQSRKEFTNSIEMKLIEIRSGEFFMGSSDSTSYGEYPRHAVRITKPFFLGQTEVTQEQWERLMGTTPWKWSTPKREWVGPPSTPATNISWYDAVSFCEKLSKKELRQYRLPTEAEWEYACRAGTTSIYSFGNEESEYIDYGWPIGSTVDPKGIRAFFSHPVASKKPNPWGLYDMHGNVAEWCSDWCDVRYYSQSPKDDPTGPSAPPPAHIGDQKVNRQGKRSSSRFSNSARSGTVFIGFRVVLEK